jgi:hypothetical protein
VKQSRKASLVEALINVDVGFGINMAMQFALFAWFGIHLAIRDGLIIGLIFTVVSIARSFILRRAFEALRVNGILP